MRRLCFSAGALLVVTALAVIWIAFPLQQPCGNKVMQEAPSADGARQALLFERSCGGTPPFYTHVSILAPDDKGMEPGGNIFVAAGHPDNTATEIRWDGPRTLVVATKARQAARRMEIWKKGVLVKYEDR